jgi:hypothetical protein
VSRASHWLDDEQPTRRGAEVGGVATWASAPDRNGEADALMPIPRALFDLSSSRSQRSTLSLLEQMTHAGVPAPETEFLFATCIGRRWAFDFAWPAYRLALEIEGAMFGRVINVRSGFEYRRVRGQKVHVEIEPNTIFRLGGRHNSGAGLNADLEKRAHAAILGWSVISVSTAMVRDDQVVPLLVQAFQQRGLKVVVPQRQELGF